MVKLFTVEEDLFLVVLVKGELRNTNNGNEWICVYVDLRVKHISRFQKKIMQSLFTMEQVLLSQKDQGFILKQGSLQWVASQGHTFISLII